MTNIDDVFNPENAKLACRREYLSDSGKYKIVITPFSTEKGCWNYTQGVVFKQGSDIPIAVVCRNYGTFPYAFIEDHPNGHSYFVAGANYQGQTVLELDTGTRRDYVPKEAADGIGFCWADYQFDPASMILTVDGCVWAAPYEYRFYDFSDPMQGWPELKFEGAYSEDKWPEFSSDGLIRCYELEPEADDADVPADQHGWASIRAYRRHGNELRFVSMWVSDAEGQRRITRAEGHRKYEIWRKEFKATDPLYLAFKEHLKDPKLNPEDYENIGVTYPGWCPGFTGTETCWGRRILNSNGYTVDLHWGVKTGPVKLTIFLDGKSRDEKFFEHSVDGMREAVAYAKSLLTPTILQRFTRLWRSL